MEDLPTFPISGAVTGEYFVSDDGSVKVAAIIMDKNLYQKVRSDLEEYEWNDADFLLATFPKNGTHFAWETLMMLLNGSAEYIEVPKALLMVDASPVSFSSKPFPSPRVLNTHYRTDVLPAEFRKGKTVVMMRNPKDSCVSSYYHYKHIKISMADDEPNPFDNVTFAQYVELFLHDNDLPYGNYFRYIEHMWSRRKDPNVFVIFYEDLKMNPLSTIERLNEFMGTNRSPEVMGQIAEAINFEKMKMGKTTVPPSKKTVELLNSLFGHANPEDIKEKVKQGTVHIYRKGDIGDWKNHFTVAQNEMFDNFLAGWEGGKDIPFKYTKY